MVDRERDEFDEVNEMPREVTQLLHQWQDGNAEALDKLYPLVYAELRRVAGNHFRGKQAGHTLQPTALVNEAYIQLMNGKNLEFKDRDQFFMFAGHVMRYLLMGHARSRMAQKRGAGKSNLSLDESIELSDGYTVDLPSLLALDDALDRLQKMDPRMTRVIELRFFAGMKNEEIAKALDISTATVKREWAAARSWLARELTKRPGV